MIRWFAMFATALVLTACVTINVYFPAAEAREAAREFVDDVIGREAAPASTTPPGGMARGGGFHPLMLLGISTAHAQSPDITIRTPAIEAIRSRMASRFQSSLSAHFDSGALGFSNDGLVVVRDAAKLDLRSRVSVNQAVADDNRDVLQAIRLALKTEGFQADCVATPKEALQRLANNEYATAFIAAVRRKLRGNPGRGVYPDLCDLRLSHRGRRTARSAAG